MYSIFIHIYPIVDQPYIDRIIQFQGTETLATSTRAASAFWATLVKPQGTFFDVGLWPFGIDLMLENINKMVETEHCFDFEVSQRGRKMETEEYTRKLYDFWLRLRETFSF